MADVAALLWARTTNEEQEEAGTFNDETRPTGTQAQNLIDQAVEDVQVVFVAGSVPEASESAARRAATLRAAYLIEITFFPEQANAGEDSAYLQLRSLSEAALQGLVVGTQLRDMFGVV